MAIQNLSSWIIEKFHSSLTPASQTPHRSVRLLTVQMRSAILGYREYLNAIKENGGSKQKGFDEVNERFAACAVKWANHAKATHIYIASDDLNTEKGEIERRIRQHLQGPHDVQFLSLSNVTSYAARVENTSKKMAVLNDKGDLRLPSLAESLILARGQVCIRTPRSTYSKISTVWWKGAFCDTIVEAPKCTATYRRLGSAAPMHDVPPSGSDQGQEIPNKSGDVFNRKSGVTLLGTNSTHVPHAMRGLVTDTYGCDGFGCDQSQQNTPKTAHSCKPKEHCCFFHSKH